MYRLFSMACLALVLAMTGAAGGDKAKELAKLDGIWVCTAATIDGKVFDPQLCKKISDTIKDGKCVTRFEGKEAATATYTLVNIGKTPAQIDLSIESGPAKGKMHKGIYKFEDGKLVTCFAAEGKDRPTAFESKKGEGGALQTMERQKADK